MEVLANVVVCMCLIRCDVDSMICGTCESVIAQLCVLSELPACKLECVVAQKTVIVWASFSCVRSTQYNGPQQRLWAAIGTHTATNTHQEGQTMRCLYITLHLAAGCRFVSATPSRSNPLTILPLAKNLQQKYWLYLSLKHNQTEIKYTPHMH